MTTTSSTRGSTVSAARAIAGPPPWEADPAGIVSEGGDVKL